MRPAAVVASDPGSGGSVRPQQTVTPTTARFGVGVSTTHRKDDHAGVAGALRDRRRARPGASGPA